MQVPASSSNLNASRWFAFALCGILTLSSTLAYPQGAPVIATPVPVAVETGSLPTAANGAPLTTAPIPTSVPVSFDVVVVPSSPEAAMKSGLRAAERGDWSTVRLTLSTVTDQRVKSMMLWRLATADSNAATFDELRRALDELNGFPARRAMRIRAEQKIGFAGLPPQATVDFLMRREKGIDDVGPISGEGKLQLASALFALGKPEDARRWLSDGWRNYRYDSATQANYLARFGAELTPQDHDARVDFLLWTDRVTQSKPLWPLMTETGRINAQRRVGIAVGDTVTLSGVMLDDRGILYQRVRNLRAANRRAEALQLLLEIDSRGLPEPGQDLIWTERRNLLNDAIVNKDWRAAYRIASTHGYSRGERFADGEFIAGWVALRFLGDANVALNHFTRLEAGVKSPVSRARALYWLGRTYDVLNNATRAAASYRAAAAYPTVFYGQLAAVKLGELNGQVARLTLPAEQLATPADKAKLNARPTMAVINMLNDLGENQFFGQFALALDDELETEGEHQALSEFARAKDQPALAVRVAKAGLNRGILATEAAFPLVPIPRIIGYGQIEDAFSLAITRQESEFNTRAISGANARGLMQFVPATAAMQARKMGVEHDTSWLISRPSHNLMLGSAHLNDLVSNFYGSYAMAAAAYNAGPGRPRQWVQTYGEFRETDLETAIDWIEKIPFSETRNYVQRVLENIQVYRARLNGGSAPLGIADDLRRGTKPPPIFNVTIVPGAEKTPEPVPVPLGDPAPAAASAPQVDSPR